MTAQPSSSSDVLTERFDRLRAEHPDCGFALYAYEPRGPVTLEIITPEADAAPYQFTGNTAAEAMAKAVPAAAAPAPEPVSIFD